VRFTLDNTIIGFIGAGNMANSLIRGLLAKGKSPSTVLAADIDAIKLGSLRKETKIKTMSNQENVDHADVIVLAVKPQIMESVCLDLNLSPPSKLIISIAAGTTVNQLQKWLGNATPVVRCMPNTPALVGKGATGMFANKHVDHNQRLLTEEIMGTVGMSAWVERESDIDIVTAVSGSGPAYFFLFMEAMEEAAQELGLREDLAKSLIYNTAVGAAELAKTSGGSAAELRKQVTSPGGTTQHALSVFEARGFKDLVHEALTAARDRSIELAKESNN